MAYRKSSEEDEDGLVGLVYHIVAQLRDTLFVPLRLLTSKVALRAYITSLLYVWTAILLFGFAIAAYVLFYWSYIPRIGFERAVHLQFDPLPPECFANDVSTLSTAMASQCADTPNPWGMINLSPDVISQQRYEVSVILHLPRTPTNTEIGNFMLDARLYAPTEKGVTPPSATANPLNALKSGLMLNSDQDETRILASSRRTAIMTYYSAEVALAQKASQLHWYLLGWRQEAETLTIKLFEGVEFAKGWRNVPSTMRLEIQTPKRQQMQIYDARISFRARLGGLRWLMYNHRFISAAFFITSFWATEMVFASAAWLVLSWIIFGGEEEDGENGQRHGVKTRDESTGYSVKEEEDTEAERMSDTERTFPTYGRHPPIRYQSSASAAAVKKEEQGLEDQDLLAQIPVLAAQDADVEDEDEDADFILDAAGKWRDSGLGTSMESSGPAGPSVRRRRRSRPSSASELL